MRLHTRACYLKLSKYNFNILNIKFVTNVHKLFLFGSFAIGILLARTELLDSPVRTEFRTESFHVVFMWLTMEFSVTADFKCDITATVTSLQWPQGCPPMVAI